MAEALEDPVSVPLEDLQPAAVTAPVAKLRAPKAAAVTVPVDALTPAPVTVSASELQGPAAPKPLAGGPKPTVPLRWGNIGPISEPPIDTTPPGEHWWEPVLGAKQFLAGAKTYASTIPAHVKQSLAMMDKLQVGSKPVPDSELNALSDMLEGAFEVVGKPLMAVGAVTQPLGTMVGLGLSAAAAKAAHFAYKAGGGSDAQARLAGNVAGALAAGVSTHEIIKTAQKSGQAFTLAAKLSGSGYGVGDVPGFRGTPFADEFSSRTGEVVDTRGATGHGFEEGVKTAPVAPEPPPPAETPVTVPVEQLEPPAPAPEQTVQAPVATATEATPAEQTRLADLEARITTARQGGKTDAVAETALKDLRDAIEQRTGKPIDMGPVTKTVPVEELAPPPAPAPEVTASTTAEPQAPATGAEPVIEAKIAPSDTVKPVEATVSTEKPVQDVAKGVPPNVQPGDIPLDLAQRAHSGTSMVPEKRAAGEQTGYVEHMTQVWGTLSSRIDKLEDKDQYADLHARATAAFEAYRQQYVSRARSLLSRRSGLMSTMIAGPSGFPVRRQQKKNDAYDKALHEFVEWDKKARGRLVGDLFPTEARAISSDRSDATQALQGKIDHATKLQATMKAVNAIIRKKGGTDAEKIAAVMAATGFKEKTATELVTVKDFMGRLGFPDYELTNNAANIRRMQARIASITTERARPEGQGTFAGGRVEENASNNRVQVFFDAKPDKETRQRLKENGFKWAPSEGAWQRQRSEHARGAVKSIFGVDLSAPATLTEAPHGEDTTPEAPTGRLEDERGGELHGAPEKRPESFDERAARRKARQDERRRVRASERRAAEREEADELDRLAALGISQGYSGTLEEARTQLADRLAGIKDLNAEIAAGGRNGMVLLRAIAKMGGISIRREEGGAHARMMGVTGQRGELEWLKEFSDIGQKGTIRGVRVFSETHGRTLDGIHEGLRLDPEERFGYIEDLNDIVPAIQKAAIGKDESRDALSDLKNYLQSNGWDIGLAELTPAEAESIAPIVADEAELAGPEEGDASFEPEALEAQTVDVNELGEAQPRLPEAGTVREGEVKTPDVAEVPFSLEREVAKRKGKQDPLFSKREPTDPDTGETFEVYIARTKRERQAWREEVAAVYARDGIVRLRTDGYGEYLLHDSLVEPGSIQITHFDSDHTPTGHTTAKSIQQAADELPGLTIVGPEEPHFAKRALSPGEAVVDVLARIAKLGYDITSSNDEETEWFATKAYANDRERGHGPRERETPVRVQEQLDRLRDLPVDVVRAVLNQEPLRSAREEQTATPAFKAWFKASKVVDAQGQPLVVYHATDADFDTFRRSEDIGFHFGTRDAAKRRAEQLDESNGTGETPSKTIAAYLSIQKPLRVTDQHLWEPAEVVEMLFSKDVITLEEAQRAVGEIEGTDDDTLIDREWVNEKMTAAGYDGFVYHNETEGGGDSWIALRPNQIKSATDNRGTFSSRASSILRSVRQEPAPIFFSVLTRAAERLKQEKGTPQQMAAMLEKAPGVKKEELEWSGVLPWIREQTGQVTRTAVLEYLRANELHVSEVELGTRRPPMPLPDDTTFTVYRPQPGVRSQWEVEYNTEEGGRNGAILVPAATEDEAIATARKRLAEGGLVDRPAKHESHTLPGGDDYREILITLPTTRLTQADRDAIRTLDDERASGRQEQANNNFRQRQVSEERPAGWADDSRKLRLRNVEIDERAREIDAEIEAIRKGVNTGRTLTWTGTPAVMNMQAHGGGAHASVRVWSASFKKGDYRIVAFERQSDPGYGDKVFRLDSSGLSGPQAVSNAHYTTLLEAQAAAEAKTQGMQLTRSATLRVAPFTGGHYGDIAPNVVAHVRIKSRIDADGRRVLFIEEIQSDWHQKGRHTGYKKVGATESVWSEEQMAEKSRLALEAMNRAARAIRPFASFGNPQVFLREIYEEARRTTPVQAVDAEMSAQYGDARQAVLEWISFEMHLQDALNQRRPAEGGVPDAPFKTTWPELALKRMVRYAAEHGYDRIAWTTGEQQAKRYDLSEHVASIDWSHNGTEYELQIETHRGEPVSRHVDTEPDLVELVGKELADKIVAAKTAGENRGRLEGLDLRIGGEGMKGFYDKMLPAAMNKIVKPWGGKVGVVRLEPAQVGADIVAETGYGMDIVRMHTRDSQTGAPGPVRYRVMSADSEEDDPEEWNYQGPEFKTIYEASTWALNEFGSDIAEAHRIDPSTLDFKATGAALRVRKMEDPFPNGHEWAVWDETTQEPAVDQATNLFASFETEADANAWLAQHRLMGVTVPGVDVTPQMREAALEGLPLFARDAMRPLGLGINLSVLRAAKAEKALLERTYRDIETHDLGGRQTAVFDAGNRYAPDEMAALLADPDFARVSQALTGVLDDVIARVISPNHASGIEGRGILFDDHTFGVFIPKPYSIPAKDKASVLGRHATILLNPFELMLAAEDVALGELDRDVNLPQRVGDRAFITAVHEALHWFIGTDGPHFEEHLGRKLEELGAEFSLEMSGRIMEAYAHPSHPTEFRESLIELLSQYQESRRREPRRPDALSIQGRRSERRPTETRGPRPPPEDVRRDQQTDRDVTLGAAVIPGGREFLEEDVIPALKGAAKLFTEAAIQLQHATAPAEVGAGVHAAGALRAGMAREAQANSRMMAAAQAFQEQWDRRLKQRDGETAAVDFIDAIEGGRIESIPAELRPAAEHMRRELDKERGEVQKVGKLDEFNRNYFPHIWKFPKQEAAWVARKLAGMMGKRPFEGSKSFLKQRTYPTFKEGLEALRPRGVEPISFNPVDHYLIKMREMRRYRVARQAIQDFEAIGIWKPFVGKPHPEGWTRIEGPLGTIYGPPQIPTQEAFDKDLLNGLETFAKSLGVTLERSPNIGQGGGVRNPWGLAYGDKKIKTKAAGPEGVLMHEIGHILDERYGLWQRIVNPAPRETYIAKKGKKAGVPVQRAVKQPAAQVKARAVIRKELRALADLRYENEPVGPGFKAYVRNEQEKMANLVHAFLWSPERAKEVAPNAYWALWNTIKAHEELAPLKDLQKTRSVKLGVRTHMLDVGGFPEIGHYAMPDDAARVFNNHLSRGLAGQSAVFDSYRWLANTMVSGQLAFSGLRHLTFTGLNALFSEGALMLQELTRAAQTKDWSYVERAAKRGAMIGATGAVGAGLGYAVGGPLGLLWATGYPLAAAKFIKGWRAKRAWQTEDVAGRFFTDHVRQMIEGGFRPTWEQIYDNGSFGNMMRAIRQGNYPGALVRALPAAIDLTMIPIMKWAVPSIKTAAYLDVAAFELDNLRSEVGAVEEAERVLAQLPTGKARKVLAKIAPERMQVIKALEAQRANNLAVIRERLNTVQASMDNRFGEVVYDNWFWRRWQKDLLHVLFRAPGWQAGTYKEILGGPIEQAGIVARRVAGAGGKGPAAGAAPPKGGEPPVPVGKGRTPAAEAVRRQEDLLSGKMAYVFALVGMTMLMNGLSQYLSTGERPEGKDWFYPKGPDGKRRAPPTYLTTLLSAWRHPIDTIGSIANPLNAAIYKIFITNQTYEGELIREPGDSFGQQAWDALTLALREGAQPFIMQNIKRGQGGVEATLGVGRAPAEVQRSKAENYLHDVMPQTPRTHEAQDRLELRRKLRDAIAGKDSAAVKAAIQEGALSRATVRNAARATVTDSLVRTFKSATLLQALHAYELATPDERRELRPWLYQKYGRLIKTVPAAEKADVIGQFKAARTLPVAPSKGAATR